MGRPWSSLLLVRGMLWAASPMQHESSEWESRIPPALQINLSATHRHLQKGCGAGTDAPPAPGERACGILSEVVGSELHTTGKDKR
ncbi:uncharacterized protein C21orf62 homolog isoform X3 [Lagopus leucura]|uniref:uncharacterized protein C21orf62 homolog isoform X3 n=1 Tax=Lagopus leucura TaxID=30410 RepID=UPI001C664447|nr:uncharacterized protein C21orf62 homolog isoform X3 [Lagopus leucura]